MPSFLTQHPLKTAIFIENIVHKNEQEQGVKILKNSNQMIEIFKAFWPNSVFSDKNCTTPDFTSLINRISKNLSTLKIQIIRHLRNTPVLGRLKRLLTPSSRNPIRALAKICVYSGVNNL